jgi:hypothetical protein
VITCSWQRRRLGGMARFAAIPPKLAPRALPGNMSILEIVTTGRLPRMA